MDNWVAIISNVGFPIAMCLIIMYYWNNQFDKAISELKDAVSRLTEVVSNNTNAINLLRNELGDDCR